MSKHLVIFLLLLTVGLGQTSAQTLTTLWQFNNPGTNGDYPEAGLVQGSDGYFYGTTYFGGNTNLNNGGGYGTVFRISSTGSLTTLYEFGGVATDGIFPHAGLAQGHDGYLYGTTTEGGTNSQGTMFRISSAGSLTTVYQFSAATEDESPVAGLVLGSDGYFYGTTYGGGTNYEGTVFRISSAGTVTTLYQFGGLATDGHDPEAGLVQGSDSYFYGTTYAGGTNNVGTVFRVNSAGSLTTLYQFSRFDEHGQSPQSGLVQGVDGYFYGATFSGGTNGDGTVYRISSAGTLTTLWQFSGADGRDPDASLLQGSDGYFYGTTVQGGATNCIGGCGTIFRISSTGTLTTQYRFGVRPTDGQFPETPLVQGSDGYFYGTTINGGIYGDGTVYKLVVPLNPPANQISAIQVSNTKLVFAVPSVAGETYQLQFTTDPSSGSWSNIGGASVTNSIGALLTLTNFGGASLPQGFYRFDITP